MTRKTNILGLFIVALLIGGCVKKESQNTTTGSEQQINDNNKPVEKENVSTANKKVKFETTMGDIVIELDAEKAPITVKNFLQYVESGFYNGTIFHRVVNSASLHVVQGGGLTKDMIQKPTNAPIKNEASNGLGNKRGTISMARTSVPDSATTQFFINFTDNDFLDYSGPTNPGYAVFGKVVEGMDVVDKIAAVQTTVRSGMKDVPVDVITLTSATVIN